jgi:RNA recognition motif-containing protein
MKVAELRAELESRGMDSKGLKAELLERLASASGGDATAAPAAEEPSAMEAETKDEVSEAPAKITAPDTAEFEGANALIVFVGNLSWETTQDQVQEAMAAHGAVSTELRTRKNGRSAGFALCTFADAASAAAAVAAMNGHELGGRPLSLRLDRGKRKKTPRKGNTPRTGKNKRSRSDSNKSDSNLTPRSRKRQKMPKELKEIPLIDADELARRKKRAERFGMMNEASEKKFALLERKMKWVEEVRALRAQEKAERQKKREAAEAAKAEFEAKKAKRAERFGAANAEAGKENTAEMTA